MLASKTDTRTLNRRGTRRQRGLATGPGPPFFRDVPNVVLYKPAYTHIYAHTHARTHTGAVTTRQVDMCTADRALLVAASQGDEDEVKCVGG